MKMPSGATILAYLGSIGLVLVIIIGAAAFLSARPPLSVTSSTLQTELRKDPRFAALSVYAETPFDDDVFVYLGGDVRAREDRRVAREWVYAHGPRILGRNVVAVMDEMHTASRGDALRTDSFQDDVRPRPLTKYLATPRRGTGDRAFFQKIGTSPEHIERIESSMSMEQDLVALGPVKLAMALLETYKQLTLYRMGVYSAEDQVARTQIMLEVWAGMPRQDVLRLPGERNP